MDRPYGLFGHIKLWTIVNGGLLICKIGILTVSTATGVGRSNGLRHIRKRRCFHWKYHTFVSLESVWIQYMWKWYHVCVFFFSNLFLKTWKTLQSLSSLRYIPPSFSDENLPFSLEKTRYSSKKPNIASVQLFKTLRKCTKWPFLLPSARRFSFPLPTKSNVS